MIITCNNCSKKFEINSDLIPDKGRLLQCSGCNYKWFFQRKLSINLIQQTEKNNKSETSNKIISKEKKVSIPKDTENFIIQAETTLKKISIKNKIPNYILIFVVSFIACIILIDTFKYQISKIIPSIDFILYNLYETIKDIVLFFSDLIL